jgi:hypothetical protein
LMEKNGLYARLYSMQFRNPEEDLAALLARSQTEYGDGKESPRWQGLLGMLR